MDGRSPHALAGFCRTGGDLDVAAGLLEGAAATTAYAEALIVFGL